MVYSFSEKDKKSLGSWLTELQAQNPESFKSLRLATNTVISEYDKGNHSPIGPLTTLVGQAKAGATKNPEVTRILGDLQSHVTGNFGDIEDSIGSFRLLQTQADSLDKAAQTVSAAKPEPQPAAAPAQPKPPAQPSPAAENKEPPKTITPPPVTPAPKAPNPLAQANTAVPAKPAVTPAPQTPNPLAQANTAVPPKPAVTPAAQTPNPLAQANEAVPAKPAAQPAAQTPNPLAQANTAVPPKPAVTPAAQTPNPLAQANTAVPPKPAVTTAATPAAPIVVAENTGPATAKPTPATSPAAAKPAVTTSPAAATTEEKKAQSPQAQTPGIDREAKLAELKNRVGKDLGELLDRKGSNDRGAIADIDRLAGVDTKSIDSAKKGSYMGARKSAEIVKEIGGQVSQLTVDDLDERGQLKMEKVKELAGSLRKLNADGKEALNGRDGKINDSTRAQATQVAQELGHVTPPAVTAKGGAAVEAPQR